MAKVKADLPLIVKLIGELQLPEKLIAEKAGISYSQWRLKKSEKAVYYSFSEADILKIIQAVIELFNPIKLGVKNQLKEIKYSITTSKK